MATIWPLIEILRSLVLILTSVCIVLSLSSESGKQSEKEGAGQTGNKRIEVANYVPKIAMFSVVAICIVAMVVFIVKRGGLTSRDDESQLSSRHNYAPQKVLTTQSIGCLLYTSDAADE